MSIRARLTTSFTVLFGAIVIALAVATYVLVSKDANLRFDAALQVATGATAMAAEHEMGEHRDRLGGERDLQEVLDDAGAAALGDTQILVRENERNAVYRRGTTNGLDISKLPSSELRNGAVINGYRITARTFHADAFNIYYQIYAAKPMAPLSAHLQRLRTGLIVLVPICLGLAAIAGSLLAKRSLRSLQLFAQTVDALSFSDLSARVHLNNEGDEIGSLAHRFNSLLDRIQDAFNTQRRFMADASHQLRTPLTVALAAAQVTGRDPGTTVEECKDSLRTIEHQMTQLRRTVEDMFLLSRSDAGSLSLTLKPMYLDDAISDAVRAAKELARPKRQTLSVEGLREALCQGDEDMLKQAILILLDNAIKFGPPEGKIELSLSRNETNWLCLVTDNGPGISPAAQVHIFDRFFRERSAGNEAVPGSGLGLAIATSIMKNHGGKLELMESRPGHTSFQFSIPVFSDDSEDNSGQAKSLAVNM